jgi:hypothetical protein
MKSAKSSVIYQSQYGQVYDQKKKFKSIAILAKSEGSVLGYRSEGVPNQE